MATGIEREVTAAGEARWAARASRRLADGRRIHWEKWFASERAALKARREWLAGAELTPAADPRRTLADELRSWAKEHFPSLSAVSRKGYEDTLRVHLYPSPLAPLRLDELTRPVIQGWYNEMAGVVGGRTQKIIHLRLCQALDHAVEAGLLARNPARGAKTEQYVPRRGTALSRDQVARFLALARQDHYHPIWHLALATGMRRAELLGLRWCDVDFARGRIKVEFTAPWLAGRTTPQARTKNEASRRGIVLDEGTLALLAEHRASQQTPAGAHDLVFRTRSGLPFGANNMHRAYKALLAEAGLPDVRIHDLRHTVNSHLLNDGVPVAAVAKRGGYKNAKVLLETYAHALEDGEERAMAAAGGLVGPR